MAISACVLFGTGDVDKVDVRALNEFAPVRFGGLIAPILREGLAASVRLRVHTAFSTGL